MEYHYPIDLDWSNDEMMDVIAFFNQIEAYYESHVKSDQVIEHYKRFKNVVPSKAEEKQIFKTFEKASGYNSYKVVQLAKSEPGTTISHSS
ncbi:UPF0223 family protein [Staphylococcus argensis]|uniref:UPF0223 protein CD039_02880 n=1 Tax=Staphylococcus argensis TaxID=1607738 RepID=A0A2K4FEB1_9STAP|nr:UPF0223 family protein [Staphylococcus argensis]MCY6991189.1 UPF0223 family protein [Staphylococcus argensis]POA09704.1 hypothetical protein CD039_02880 [Staphylococcus argensis]